MSQKRYDADILSELGLSHFFHKHHILPVPGVGELLRCSSRFSRYVAMYFKPDLSGASWHPLVTSDIRSLLYELGKATTPHQAMAVIRAASE